MSDRPKLRKWNDLRDKVCTPEQIAYNEREARLMIYAIEAQEMKDKGFITEQELTIFRKVLDILQFRNEDMSFVKI